MQVELVFRCFFKVCNHSVGVQDDGPRDLCKKQLIGQSAGDNERELTWCMEEFPPAAVPWAGSLDTTKVWFLLVLQREGSGPTEILDLQK